MFRVFLLLQLFTFTPLFAQDASVISDAKLLEKVKQDLAESTKNLSQQRDSIAAEKAKQGAEFTKLHQELAQQRRKVRLARMSTAERKQMLTLLETSKAGVDHDVSLMSQQLKNYGFHLSAKSLPGEQSVDAPLLALESGIDRLENLLGGGVLEVTASDEQSQIHQGKAVQVGPLLWFKSNDGSAMGRMRISKSGRVASISSDDLGRAEAEALHAGKEVSCEIDVTGGKAAAIQGADASLLELVKKGGLWVYPILGLALLAFICALVKFIQVSGLKQPKLGWLYDIIELEQAGKHDEIDAKVAKLKHPIAKVLPLCLASSKHGASVVEEVLYEQLIDVREQLRAWLPFISITAATAPLLGLLGTVSGLIKTFNVISIEGTGEAQTFAGGISEALITTLFGLMVAIPAFILHALLARKSKGVEQATEKLGLSYVNSLRKQDTE